MTINTDSFGNKYFNKFSPQITRDTRCQIRLEIGELRDSMASLMPPGDFFENSINYFYIRFSNSTYENFTGNITISANYRFIVNLEYSRPGYINAGNPSNHLPISNVINFGAYIQGGTNNYSDFVVVDNDSLFIATFDNTGTNLVFKGFTGVGYAVEKAPNSFPLSNVFMIGVDADNASAAEAKRLVGVDSTSLINIQTSGAANYPITCKSDAGHGTNLSGLSTTNLVLVDEGTDAVIGELSSNILLGKGGFLQGEIYTITGVGRGEANLTPNTEQNTFLCVCPWGSDMLLMRVFAD